MKKAIALSYDEDKDKAPIIQAKGKGEVAEQILERAEESSIPIYKNKELVEELMIEEVGDQIPTELYDVVAEILIFINDIDDQMT